jgi:hypothetical protein
MFNLTKVSSNSFNQKMKNTDVIYSIENSYLLFCSCPTYSNLPQGCRLVKDAGGCCSTPKCSFATTGGGLYLNIRCTDVHSVSLCMYYIALCFNSRNSEFISFQTSAASC